MPHVHDDSRWVNIGDGIFVRAQGDEEKRGPNATEGAIELAAAYGLDLSEVKGTGKDGRVTKANVEDHLEANG